MLSLPLICQTGPVDKPATQPMSSSHNPVTVDAIIQAGNSAAASGLESVSFDAHGIITRVATSSPAVAGAVNSFVRAFKAGGGDADIEMTFFAGRPGSSGFPELPPDLPLLYDWGMIRIYNGGSLRFLTIDGDRGLVVADLESSTAAGCLDESLLESDWLISHLAFYPLWGQLLKTRGLFPLHAAGLAKDGKAILFPGRSGSGKSTLTLQMVRSGYGLLSDDTVLLRNAGERIEAMAFPEEINVNEDAADFFPDLAKVKNLTANDARQKSSFAIEELYPQSVVEGAEPALLIFPQITDAEKTSFAPMSRTEALTLGLRYAFLFLDPSTTGRHFEVLSRLAKQVRCYRLFSGRDQEDLVRVVESLFAGEPETPDIHENERGE